MYILALDTSLGAFSMTLGLQDEIIDTYIYYNFNQQSRLLAPALVKLLQKNNVSIEQIETILVTRGPGSFTGIKLGLAFVIGLKQPNRKVYSCPTFCALELELNDCILTLHTGNRKFYATKMHKGKPSEEITIFTWEELQKLKEPILGNFKNPLLLPSTEIMFKKFHLHPELFSSSLEAIYN